MDAMSTTAMLIALATHAAAFIRSGSRPEATEAAVAALTQKPGATA